jgi:hypothetical protein
MNIVDQVLFFYLFKENMGCEEILDHAWVLFKLMEKKELGC